MSLWKPTRGKDRVVSGGQTVPESEWGSLRRGRGACLGLVLCAVALSANASAQEAQGGPIIQEVVLQSNSQINPSLILDNIKTQKGAAYDDKLAQEDVRTIFTRFGLLASFSLEKVPGGVRVILDVREDLRIKGFAFRGVDSSEEEDLRKELGLEKETFPNRYMVRAYALKIRQYYRDKGYYFAQATALFERQGDGVLCVFEVFMGEKVVVSKIRFLGLDQVDEGDLRSVMELDEPTLWIFTDKLKEDVLDRDIAGLNTYLKEEGWLDGRATLEALEFDDDFDDATIVIRIQEGPRYKVRSVKVEGPRAFFPAQLEALIHIQPGDFYRENRITADVRRLQRFYWDRGYIRTEVRGPDLRYDESRPLVDLIFRIQEDRQKSVRDVVISGNELTRDKVIRREITLTPGDFMNYRERQWSYNQLVATQFFSNPQGVPQVKLVPRPTGDPELEDLMVEVGEGGTGLFSFNVGVSTDTGLIGGVKVNKTNFDIANPPSSLWALPYEFFASHEAFHGGGQTLSLEAMPGTYASEYGIRFFEPYLFDTQPYPISFSLGLYRNDVDESDWSTRRLGVSPVIGKQWSREFYTSLGLRSELINLYHLQDDAPPSIREFEGENGLRGVELGFSFRDIDNIRTPSIGYAAFLNYDYTGGPLGADIEISKAVVGNTIYLPAYETSSGLKHVFTLKGTFGWAEPHGGADMVPPFERFYPGGASGNFPLRGLAWHEVGPQENNQYVGGDAAWGFSAEYSIPLISEYNREYDAEETRLKGIFFYDAGGVASDIHDPDLFDKIRSTTGLGLKLSLPVLGGLPITVYYGIPLKKYPGDSRQSFNISISSVF